MLYPDELWMFKCNMLTSLLGLTQMDPHLLLVIFLPPLLFESAYAMDNAIFDTQFAQIFLLAIPGVLVSSLLTAVIVWGLYQTWSSFTFGWLAGTILSATDPVAVVALLKEVGAAKTLGTLIEGESLLNDGSSVVLFTFIMSLVRAGVGVDEYDDQIPWTRDVIIEFLRIIAQMLFLGPLFGYMMGHACCRTLRSVYNDMVVEVAVIISCTYLTFWVSEVLMKSAAVLSVVMMGYVINNERLSISVEVHHFLHEFFEMIAWCLNTVIFLICGVKLGEVIASIVDPVHVIVDYDGIALSDMWRALCVYLGCNAVRLTTITLFSPMLKNLGTGFDWRTGLVVVWGGLRGSVGLALALVVLHTQYLPYWGGPLEEPETFSQYQEVAANLPCRDVPTRILTLTSWIVLLTVIVNGSLMAKLIEVLGLDALSDDRKFMLDRAMKKLKSETAYIIGGIKSSSANENVDWSLVRERFTYHKTFDFIVSDEAKAAQMQALNMERMSYLEQHEKGEISDRAASFLQMYMVRLQARAETASKQGAADDAAQMYNETVRRMEALFQVSPWKVSLRSFWLTRDWAERAVFDDLSLAYEVGKAYIKATECVKKLYVAQRNRHMGHGPNGANAPHGSHLPHYNLPKMHDCGNSSASSLDSNRHDELTRISTRGLSARERSDLERIEHERFKRIEILGAVAHGPEEATDKIDVLQSSNLANLSRWKSKATRPSTADPPATKPPSTEPPAAHPSTLAATGRDSSSPEHERPVSDRFTAALKRRETHIESLDDLARGRERHADRMHALIQQMQESYPDVSLAVETRYVATLVLRKQLRVVEKMRHDGELSEMDAVTLADDINKQRKTLFYARAHVLGNKGPKETLLEVPAFRFLSLAIVSESMLKGRDTGASSTREECKVLLDRLVDKLAVKAYNSEDIVIGQSVLKDRNKEEAAAGSPEALRMASVEAAAKSKTVGRSGPRRRSVLDTVANAAVVVAQQGAHVAHLAEDLGHRIAEVTRKDSKEAASSAKTDVAHVGREVTKEGGEVPSGGSKESGLSAHGSGREGGVGPTTRGKRGSVFSGKKLEGEEKEVKEAKEAKRRLAERSAELYDMYDNLIVVKRGQLSYGEDVAAGSQIPGSQIPGSQIRLGAMVGSPLRKLGPFSAAGVPCVLQQMNLDELDRTGKLPPTIRCTRAAEVLVISGKCIRDAIRDAGAMGEALMRELWCMHAKEVASRFMRARQPYVGWPETQLGEHLERGSLLEWDDDDTEVRVRMVHMGMLIAGECIFEAESMPTTKLPHANSIASKWMSTVLHAKDASLPGYGRTSMRSSVHGGVPTVEDNDAVEWRQAPVMLRPGDVVRIRQADPLTKAGVASAPAPATAEENSVGAVASACSDTDSSQQQSRRLLTAPSPAAAKGGARSERGVQGAPSGEARMPGHSRIRLVALPSDNTPLLMHAPCVMPIAVDSSAPRYGRDVSTLQEMSLQRQSDLKRVTQRTSAVATIPGLAKLAGKSMRSLVLSPPSKPSFAVKPSVSELPGSRLKGIM